MCIGIGAGIGMALGIASGVAQASAQAEAAENNQNMAIDQAKAEYAQQQRELIVEKDAALKEANEAHLEGEAAAAYGRAKGEGMGGTTAGLREGEQMRQKALNIYKAEDRSEAASANYLAAGKNTELRTYHQLKQNEYTPMQAFGTILGSV